MGNEGLALTLAAVMDVGGVVEVDLRDARDAHLAILTLHRDPSGPAACERFHVTVLTTPDPDVGVRVRGLTQALWSAISLHYLEPVGDSSVLALTDAARSAARAVMDELPVDELAALRGAGHAWACRSTARNALASAFASPPGK